jgi:translation initiation factor IF-2
MSPPTALDGPSDQHAHGTVGAFAAELRKSPETLLEQLRLAGVEKASAYDPLSDQDKSRLLGYLQASNPERKRIRLVKSDIRKPAARSQCNAVILVGGLGHFAYEQADAAAKKLLDAYRELVRTIYVAGLRAIDDDGFDRRYREACRRMSETLKQLRKFVKRVQRPAEGALRKTAGGAARHGGAFFHALKVDGRNLP